jgi:hypothetical protein
MEKQEQIRSSYKIRYKDRFYIVYAGAASPQGQFTTEAKAKEFIECRVAERMDKYFKGLIREMRKEPDLKKRTRMWKKICKLRSQQ